MLLQLIIFYQINQKIYLDYCKENLDKPTLLEIVSLLVNFSKNYKLLNELKEIIIEKSEKIVYKLLHLMRIYYKTKEQMTCSFYIYPIASSYFLATSFQSTTLKKAFM